MKHALVTLRVENLDKFVDMCYSGYNKVVVMVSKGVGIGSLHIHALKMSRVSVCGLSRLLQVLF